MRKGDIGLTDLLNESSVKKSDPRVMALAHMDEFMAALGLAKLKTGIKDLEVLREYLGGVMALAAGLNADLSPNAVDFIETKTAELEKEVQPPAQFVPLDKNENQAALNIARAKCRTAEVYLTALSLPETDAARFINRCSRYLFLLCLKQENL